jgi:hypothetical protein
MSKVFEGINWTLFREQKQKLIQLANRDIQGEVDLLNGLVNFLDHFMDCAAEELGESVVFGKPVGFEFEGTWIINPYVDHGGQFNPVVPSFYGFKPSSTGGGYDELVKELPYDHRSYIVIVDTETDKIPTKDTKPEHIQITHISAGGMVIARNTLADAIAALEEQCKP